MSYYGPASEPSPKTRKRSSNGRLAVYDYSKHDECSCPTTAMQRAGNFNRHNKRLRKNTRVVPWRGEWELQAVGEALLSVLDQNGLDIDHGGRDRDCDRDRARHEPSPPPNTDMPPEEAFAMIAVWKSRLASLEGLPHAIESTAAVAQVYWRDSQQRMQRASGAMGFGGGFGVSVGVSLMELRLAYSAAIVRCINGFADSLQQQRAMAASVSNLCGQLGIPSWLVDTRHESSHNSLPNLEVLRLSASTLLEFMKVQFWIPRCPNWNGGDASTGGNLSNAEQNNSSSSADLSPIDCLIRYKACASSWAKTRSTVTNENESKRKGGATGKQKQKASSAPLKTTILPFDPLFGEVGNFMNSFWGSSIGTNANRYLLLEIPEKKKKKGKEKNKKRKAIQNNPKKKKGEKSPNDCARVFVQSVSSLQEGYAIAIQYLVWGGVGGAPGGRGVLIPGSEVAFPASPQGVSKCWQRYSPLIHVISRAWPGFAAHMITHLVDCVLSIEDGGVVYDSDDQISAQRLDAGSIRKLYFLYAWIRLILSQRFVAALDPNFSVKDTNTKNVDPLDLPLARLDHLESLGYPLNSLLDRLRRHDNPHHTGCNDEYDTNSKTSHVPGSESMGTSGDIIQNLETILGPKVTRGFGYPGNAVVPQEANSAFEPSLVNHSPKNKDAIATNATPNAKELSVEMSLDEMEAMLLAAGNNHSGEEEMEAENLSTVAPHEDKIDEAPVSNTEQEILNPPKQRRPAWIRCERWDACAIGTLPGYP
eukprot:jgi/Psemu1/237155/estExt_Genewise1.C_640008